MKKFRFRTFQVYQDARVFCRNIKSITKKFPKEEQFCLSSQLWRAVISITLNIAEGSERGSDKDFAHFLSIANASLNEVVACIDIALDNEYLNPDEVNKILLEAEALSNQLTAFRKKLIKP